MRLASLRALLTLALTLGLTALGAGALPSAHGSRFADLQIHGGFAGLLVTGDGNVGVGASDPPGLCR